MQHSGASQDDERRHHITRGGVESHTAGATRRAEGRETQDTRHKTQATATATVTQPAAAAAPLRRGADTRHKHKEAHESSLLPNANGAGNQDGTRKLPPPPQ
jgi:hypothetical protein